VPAPCWRTSGGACGCRTIRNVCTHPISPSSRGVEVPAGNDLLRIPPDLAVEIYPSTSNRKPGDFQKRIRDYLDGGVRLLWVIYPDARCAMVYRPDGSARMVREHEALEGEDVLPGLRIELAGLFREMP
jgi:Uma2 family endonuclease